jgi:hypothetical protein
VSIQISAMATARDKRKKIIAQIMFFTKEMRKKFTLSTNFVWQPYVKVFKKP